jgi:hypothetical protein
MMYECNEKERKEERKEKKKKEERKRNLVLFVLLQLFRQW